MSVALVRDEIFALVMDEISFIVCVLMQDVIFALVMDQISLGFCFIFLDRSDKWSDLMVSE